ncbi:MAG TPA: hypothetical protein PLK34_01305 [Candidatus Pacearchaeota archaeon]|nr:hypothetical protein [Candidatus Pacearchaeota archaeon]
MNFRYKRSDPKNAISILEAAKREIEYTLTLEVTEKSCSTIIRNIYECFRMMGDALLTYRGKVTQDHAECIKELMKLNIKSERALGALDNLRILRHNINYYGYQPKIEEVKDALSLTKALFEPLYKVVFKEVNK